VVGRVTCSSTLLAPMLLSGAPCFQASGLDHGVLQRLLLSTNMLKTRVTSTASATAQCYGEMMGKFAMTSLKDRSVSHKGRRTRIASRVRKRVNRATNFATKVDLMTAQYSAEELDEIAELLRILAAKPQVRHRLEARTPCSASTQ